MRHKRHHYTLEFADAWVTFAARNSPRRQEDESRLIGLEFEYVAAQLYVGPFELDLHTPLETAQKTSLEAFHLGRRTIARHDNLLVVLVEMVEMWKNVFCVPGMF